MTKEHDGDFENSSRLYLLCQICDNSYADGDIKVRNHCHETGKYRGSAHRDCNTNVKLNGKFPSYSTT